MSHKEKAVEIYTKFFLKLKNIPFEERIDKAKVEANKYIEDKISKNQYLPETENNLYWEFVKNYVKKIDVKYNKQNEKLNNNCKKETMY
jgi:hypothetical protein